MLKLNNEATVLQNVRNSSGQCKSSPWKRSEDWKKFMMESTGPWAAPACLASSDSLAITGANIRTKIPTNRNRTAFSFCSGQTLHEPPALSSTLCHWRWLQLRNLSSEARFSSAQQDSQPVPWFPGQHLSPTRFRELVDSVTMSACWSVKGTAEGGRGANKNNIRSVTCSLSCTCRQPRHDNGPWCHWPSPALGYRLRCLFRG